MHGVRSLRARDADGVRRGPARRPDDARGGAARRPRRSRGSSLRRARRAAARPGVAGARIDRGEVYVTNAVKHFKWRPAGKVRLHQKPNAAEIRACSRWWKAELDAVQPAIVVLLGATAAQAVLGPKVRVTRDPRADPRGAGRRDAGAGHDPSLRDPADEAARTRRGLRRARARPRRRAPSISPGASDRALAIG